MGFVHSASPRTHRGNQCRTSHVLHCLVFRMSLGGSTCGHATARTMQDFRTITQACERKVQHLLIHTAAVLGWAFMYAYNCALSGRKRGRISGRHCSGRRLSNQARGEREREKERLSPSFWASLTLSLLHAAICPQSGTLSIVKTSNQGDEFPSGVTTAQCKSSPSTPASSLQCETWLTQCRIDTSPSSKECHS